MNDVDDIKRLLIPVIKRSPIIAILFLSAFLFARKMTEYITPMYQSMVKVKIDISGSNSVSESNLFQDFDVFTTKSTAETEVEVIKSNVLIEKTLERLERFNISIWRKGEIKKAELFDDCPFKVTYRVAPVVEDRLFELQVLNEDTFLIKVTLNNEPYLVKGVFGKLISAPHFDMLFKIDNLNKKKYKLIDNYQFRIHSRKSLVNKIKGALDVKAVDKDIDVIRITYKHEVPEKAAMFLDALANTYIDDYINNKGETAARTIDFVNKQLEIVSIKLRKAELALESYKLKNKIVNTSQETATDLNKISQLKVQLTNVRMQESVLNNLEESIRTDKELAISFDAFRGNLFSELVKKLQGDRAILRELLVKYQPSHQKVKNINKAIEETKQYIFDAITNERESIVIKRRQINRAINSAASELADLPTKEKHIVVLSRKFALLEANYNFLAKKKIEASILEEANIALHRIIESPQIPRIPVSPNRNLIAGLVGFLVLISSIVYIFLKRYIKAVFVHRSEIEKYSEVPVIATIPKIALTLNKIKQEKELRGYFKNVVSHLLLHKVLKKGHIVSVASSVKDEGKTYVAKNIAISLSKIGWKTLFIDFDLRKEDVVKAFPGSYYLDLVSLILGEVSDVKEVVFETKYKRLSYVPNGSLPTNKEIIIDYQKVQQIVEEVKKDYDVVIFNTPPTIMQSDAIFLMQQSNLNLYVARANYTKYRVLDNPDMIKEEFAIENLYYVINGVAGRINSAGYYVTDIISFKEIKDYLLEKYFFIKKRIDKSSFADKDPKSTGYPKFNKR